MKIQSLLLILGLIGLIQTARSQNFTFAYDNEYVIIKNQPI